MYYFFNFTLFHVIVFKIPMEFLQVQIQHPDFRHCPVGWGCRIHRLHLSRRVKAHLNECPDNDTKQSDGEVPVLLPALLWLGVVAPDRVLFMG